MTLSIYDPTKGCNVLNPANFTINAFHPDYIKTYYPELLTTIKAEATQVANGTTNGIKARARREAAGEKNINTIHVHKKPAHVHRTREDILKRTDFRVFSKAGAANVTPKGKK